MAYNRYVNNNGVRRRVVVQEPAQPAPPRAAVPVAHAPRPSGPVMDLAGIGGMIKNILPSGLDTGDILLFAVLFLLYLESGDIEMLIILGALFFMK